MTANELSILRARMTPAELTAFELGRMAGAEQTPTAPTFDLNRIKPGMSKDDEAAALRAIQAALAE